MWYRSLYCKYTKDANILGAHIRSLKREFKCTPPENREMMKYRISILYGMYLDLKHTAEYLSKKM